MHHPLTSKTFNDPAQPLQDLADLVIGPSRGPQSDGRNREGRRNSSPVRLDSRQDEESPKSHMKSRSEEGENSADYQSPSRQQKPTGSRSPSSLSGCSVKADLSATCRLTGGCFSDLEVVMEPMNYYSSYTGILESGERLARSEKQTPPRVRPGAASPVMSSVLPEASSAEPEDSPGVNTPSARGQPSSKLLQYAQQLPQVLFPIQQNAFKQNLPQPAPHLGKLGRRPRSSSSSEDAPYDCESPPRKILRTSKPAEPTPEIGWFQFNLSKEEDLLKQIEHSSRKQRAVLKNRLASLRLRIRDRVVENKFNEQLANKELKMKVLSDALKEVLSEDQWASIAKETLRTWAEIDTKLESKLEAAVKKEGLVVKGQLRHRVSARTEARLQLPQHLMDNRTDLERIFETPVEVIEFLRQ